MDFNDLPILQMMTKKMSWLSRRTEVISQNVANVDTPNYKGRDLKEVSFADLVRNERNTGTFAPRQTHALHLIGTKPLMPFADKPAPDRYESTIDGNDVSVEQQLTRLGETQMSYQMTLNVYRKHLDMIRTAIGRPGR